MLVTTLHNIIIGQPLPQPLCVISKSDLVISHYYTNNQVSPSLDSNETLSNSTLSPIPTILNTAKASHPSGSNIPMTDVKRPVSTSSPRKRKKVTMK